MNVVTLTWLLSLLEFETRTGAEATFSDSLNLQYFEQLLLFNMKLNLTVHIVDSECAKTLTQSSLRSSSLNNN